MFSLDLFLNAIVAGVLLGGFYAAVSLGISVTFGLLDVVNIAHPVFVILGSYTAFTLNNAYGLDPLLASLLFVPLFFVIGVVVYQFYYLSFEKKGESSLRGLVFFFGLLFIIEVALLAEVRRRLSPRRGAVHRPSRSRSARSASPSACWCRAWWGS